MASLSNKKGIIIGGLLLHATNNIHGAMGL